MIITVTLLLLSTLYVLNPLCTNYTYDQLLMHLLVDSIYYPPLSLLMVNIQNGEESLLFSKWGVYMRETGDIELYLLSNVGMHILLSIWSCSAFEILGLYLSQMTSTILLYLFSAGRGIFSPSWYLLENCLSFLHSYPFYYLLVKNMDIEGKGNIHGYHL